MTGTRRAQRLLIGAGALVMVGALVGALTDPDIRPVGHLVFLAGLLLAHDGVLLPLVIGVGVLIGRLTPPAARPAVRLAALVSLSLCLIALPVLLRPEPAGLSVDGPAPSYGRGLVAVLLVLWAVALGHAWRQCRRDRTPWRAAVLLPRAGRAGKRWSRRPR